MFSGTIRTILLFVALAAAEATETEIIVQLFQWRWSDVAQECETFLGPKGFGAVQVSPAMEQIQGDAWWTSYQPVSYKLQNRLGSESEFESMVATCKKAGVKVYADAVINHMAAGSGTGTAGSSYGGRNFPGTYGPQDFHHNQNDQGSNCAVNNYQDKWNVQHCDLVGLPDLDTSSNYVQTTIGNYLKHLSDLGVAGFRVDASKHMDDNELAGILSHAGNPFNYQEVIEGAGEAVHASSYYHNGQVTEFGVGSQIGMKFKNGGVQYLSTFGQSWGLMPSDDAIAFMDNHDSQRGSATLTYKDGDKYFAATAFMMAWTYGHVRVMSSYYFGSNDQGPPNSAVHYDGSAHCGPGTPWVCEHRDPQLANLARWRKEAASGAPANWHSEGEKISFSRGSKAFIAINNEGGTWTTNLQTGLPEGRYCDVAHDDNCDSVVVVDGNGSAQISVNKVVAIHIGAPATKIWNQAENSANSHRKYLY
ncbi:hypothetical protein CYMTET_20524 [Cymbomonas tetramitiformis]|uniref:Alpha-amylase n=1 Tax=Cymbomonas tetramitiformis TaxID=36881 RepID=A0AAE0G3W1_9CHLO|nr:hypothetical protein CYMTET_20524 [Cymbomonas tetramitiformis]